MASKEKIWKTGLNMHAQNDLGIRKHVRWNLHFQEQFKNSRTISKILRTFRTSIQFSAYQYTHTESELRTSRVILEFSFFFIFDICFNFSFSTWVVLATSVCIPHELKHWLYKDPNFNLLTKMSAFKFCYTAFLN